MTDDADVIELERAGWRALSSAPARATEFYAAVLAERATFLLPGGLVLRGRTDILRALAGPPWTRHELRDLHVVRASTDAAVVTYAVVAVRLPAGPYSALASSVYQRRGSGWRLYLHQQTPFEADPRSEGRT